MEKSLEKTPRKQNEKRRKSDNEKAKQNERALESLRRQQECGPQDEECDARDKEQRIEISAQEECQSCRSRKMLQNAFFLAIVAVDTDENEPLKILK